jgi:hypothetical protein
MAARPEVLVVLVTWTVATVQSRVQPVLHSPFVCEVDGGPTSHARKCGKSRVIHLLGSIQHPEEETNPPRLQGPRRSFLQSDRVHLSEQEPDHPFAPVSARIPESHMDIQDPNLGKHCLDAIHIIPETCLIKWTHFANFLNDVPFL